MLSLLLCSSLIEINGLYAADAKTDASESKKADDVQVKMTDWKPGTKFKVPSWSVAGNGDKFTATGDVEVTIADQEDTNTMYDTKIVLDSGIYRDVLDSQNGLAEEKRNIGPFIPGQKLPEGYKFVWLLKEIDDKATLDTNSPFASNGGRFMLKPDSPLVGIVIEGAAGNQNAVPDPKMNLTKDGLWALMNDKNEIFIPKVQKDPDAEKTFGGIKYHVAEYNLTLESQADARYYNLPNAESTKKLQDAQKEAKDIKEKLDKAGVSDANGNTLAGAADSAAGAAIKAGGGYPYVKEVSFNNQKFLLVGDENARQHPELFLMFKDDIEEFFNEHPTNATQIILTMLDTDKSDLKKSKTKEVVLTKTYKKGDEDITLTGSLMFPRGDVQETIKFAADLVHDYLSTPEQKQTRELAEQGGVTVKDHEAVVNQANAIIQQKDAEKNSIAAQAVALAQQNAALVAQVQQSEAQKNILASQLAQEKAATAASPAVIVSSDSTAPVVVQ